MLSEVEDLGYLFFLRRVQALIGVDLSDYKSQQMKRRLTSLMARSKAKNFVEYSKMLESDPKQLQAFKDFFTINVSEFFRDPNKFDQLKNDIFPLLLRDRRPLDIWSAGCSYGAEPYTLAIILDRISPLIRHRILATDIDQTILQRARRADSFSTADLRSVPPALISRYFIPTGEKYKLVDDIRTRVDFKQHNLLSDRIGGAFDLIVCRNVVIYFTDEAKEQLYKRFWRHLKPGGVLFVGGTEVINTVKTGGFEAITTSFYRKVE